MCVFVCEREGARGCVFVLHLQRRVEVLLCVCERECVCDKERACVRAFVQRPVAVLLHVCVCVRERVGGRVRGTECVCVWERERACMCAFVQHLQRLQRQVAVLLCVSEERVYVCVCV